MVSMKLTYFKSRRVYIVRYIYSLQTDSLVTPNANLSVTSHVKSVVVKVRFTRFHRSKHKLKGIPSLLI